MASKIIVLFALVAAASALPQHYYEQPALIKSYQPAVVKKIAYDHHEHEEPANYDFEYSVHDGHTGDVKEHHESAKNGAVEGYYTLIDADGYRRVVHYTANHEQGFIAKVEREPIQGQQKIAQPVVAKVVAPVVQKVAVAAPQYYSPAPVVQKVTEVKYPTQYYNNHY
ncbi:hypothetical protein PVAND_006479 [Polypedilum vanderplanki]|uniref:Cuticle protein n=1 Tax=Polypedilum vanderplanki TaxID=319348 RepID=A0A9J6C428_POLVA|nr:hypothetical protein PVAND_006479 [Polypedilum vanderplanki]